MSSQIALVANEPVRASTDRSRHSEVVDQRAGGLELVKQSTPAVSTAPTTVEAEATDLKTAVETVRTVVADLQRQLQFTVDEDSGRTIITVIDRNSGEIVRQIPSEEILQIAERVANGGSINLIDGQA